MESDFILYLIHISGDRMIDCGVYILSRDYPTVGIFRGEPILSFIPLHLSAEERIEGVVPLIQSCWFSEENVFTCVC